MVAIDWLYRAATGYPAAMAPLFHGPGDGSDPEDLTRCWSCGFETHELVESCPRCGATMQSRRWSRRYGVLLVVLGSLLSAGMGILLWMLLPTLLHAGMDVGGTRFNGDPQTARMVIAILGAVLLFGLTTLGYGIFQVVTGRRSWPVVAVLLAIFAALYALGLAL